MRFDLRGYQETVVGEVLALVDEGRGRFANHGKHTAISLAAPTGAGKTVMATAVVEQILFGGEDRDRRPQTTVLWVTDDPSLNQQTRKKMLVASDQLEPRHITIVDSSFDERVFSPGGVYFLHIQQLGAGATGYNRVGDRRQYALWDTIANTITEFGADVVLVIDEAHKGTGKSASGATITSRIAEGNNDRFPPAPILIGISATPDRFIKAITEKTNRTLERVAADEDEVRESGLIKDVVQVKHPTESQPSDSTLLELAVADLRAWHDAWAAYARDQDEPAVRPVLVIQVRPNVSAAELTERLATLESAWSVLTGSAIAHSFQDHTTLALGARSVRYLAPQDIQDDANVRVVLFKEALTTGWDCPRAEVMVSFRTAKDHTYIAQLIGRMVRTPLARRITTDARLNAVALYLPHYDDAGVAAVIRTLVEDEGMPPTRMELNPVTCVRNPAVPAYVWDQLGTLPTYTRPAKNHRSEVARLNSFATLLVGAELHPTAMADARGLIISTLAAQEQLLGADAGSAVAGYQRLNYASTSYDTRTRQSSTETLLARVNARNINDLFARSRRRLGDAAAKWYWDSLCDAGEDPDTAKLRTTVVADEDAAVAALETAASNLIDAWRNTHMSAINDLPERDRDAFYNIWRQAKDPQLIQPILPTTMSAADQRVTGRGADQRTVPIPRHPRHLYVNGRGTYPANLTGWEAEVLTAELGKDTLVAWYRNPTGGPAAVAVPYKDGATARTLYPDFLFIHEIAGAHVIDVVDPHLPSAADAAPKWRGLAAYAATHAASFRKVLAVIKEGDDLRALDLRNPHVSERLGQANGESDIRRLFEDLGGAY